MKTMQTAILVFSLLRNIIGFHTAVSQPVIVASPPEIDVGLSGYLDVNCTVSVAGWSSVAALISLTVSRNSSQTGWTELAIISDFSKGEVNVMTAENLTTNGWFKASGSASVSLHWDYPTYQQAGSYICSAQGFDTAGHTLVSNTDVQVSTNIPGLSDVQEKIREMDIQMKTQKEQLTSQIQTLELEVSELRKKQDRRFSEMFEQSFEFENHTYYVSRDAFYEIHASIAICRMYGGYLTEVDNRNEYNAIQSFLKSTSGLDRAYISGTDQRHEGTWTLFSGEPLPFIDWGTNEPDNLDYQDCLSILHEGGDVWRMYEIPCHKDEPYPDQRFMCEMP